MTVPSPGTRLVRDRLRAGRDDGTRNGGPWQDGGKNRGFLGKGEMMRWTVAFVLAVTILFAAAPSATGRIIYVDGSAKGANDGTSWLNAYPTVQAGLDAARAGDEVRVAQGTYKPDEGPGRTARDQSASFKLISGVTLKGGYCGTRWSPGTDPGARNIDEFKTILSGEIGAVDVTSDNCCHVVDTSAADATALLDGFTVTGGFPRNHYPTFQTNALGAGIYNEGGSPRIANCKITGNQTGSRRWYPLDATGGGMYNLKGSPVITNCHFSANQGQGLCSRAGDPTVTQCRFTDNTREGLWNTDGAPTITDCTFAGNARGIRNNAGSSAAIANCTFAENIGVDNEDGGGILNDGDVTIANCTFSRNGGGLAGGGIYNSGDATITNCTFTENWPQGIYSTGDTTITNCILWANSAELVSAYGGNIDVAFSIVEGGWPGTRNMDRDPRLADDLGHLAPDSPCIDAADNSALLPHEVTTDRDGNPRYIDDPQTADTGQGQGPIADIGAFEFVPPGFGAGATTSGLIGHWPLDESQGDIARDRSGHGHDGMLYGDPAWSPAGGRVGGALVFDGLDDYIDCGNPAALNIQDEITLACWIKVAAFTRDWETILAKGDGSYRLSRSGLGNAIHFGIGGTSAQRLDGVTSVADDEWHHVAGVYDGSQAAIYVDGIPDAAVPATGKINTSPDNLFIGENSQNRGRYLKGLVDDVRIYDRALDATEVLTLAMSPTGP